MEKISQFAVIASEAVESIAEAVHGTSGALLLYDEIADAFSVASTFGSGFGHVRGRELAARDAEPVVHVIESNAPASDMAGGLTFPGTDGGAPMAVIDGPFVVVGLHSGGALGAAVISGGEISVSIDNETMTAIRGRAEQLERALPGHQHHCLFRNVLESNPGAMAVVETGECVFTYASHGFRRLYNLADSAFLGRRIADVLGDAHADQLMSLVVDVGRNGQARYVKEMPIVDQYGPRYHDLHLMPDLGIHGPASVLIVAWARTDSYLTRQALQNTVAQLGESESLLTAVLDASNSGISFVSRSGVLAYANARVQDFFDLDLNELIGKRCEDGMWPSMTERVADPDAFSQRLHYLYSHMEEKAVDEVVVMRPVERTLQRYTAPVYSDEGQLLGRVESYTDVTQVRELERNKDAFLSLVSHELRTPVTSIKGYAQLLQRRARREQPSEQTLLAYSSIERQTSRMQDLIDMLLDVSRLETGRLRLAVADVNVGDVVRHVAQTAQMTADDHEIEVRIPARPVWIEADEQRIEHVVTNLISNAIRYSPLGGTVTVSVDEQEDQVHIGVRDCGFGIPSESLPHVFERFYRVSGAPESRGLGVGLYITKSIVERHGGSISVESVVGEGSTFSVHLPRTSSHLSPT